MYADPLGTKNGVTHIVARCCHHVRLLERHHSFVEGSKAPSVQRALIVGEGHCLLEPASGPRQAARTNKCVLRFYLDEQTTATTHS